MHRFSRFLVEYVGNLELLYVEGATAPRKLVDRRRNLRARELVDWIKRQMEARGLPATKKDEMVHDLRRSLAQEIAEGKGMPRDESP